jgi:hypothetical protein
MTNGEWEAHEKRWARDHMIQLALQFGYDCRELYDLADEAVQRAQGLEAIGDHD